LRRARAAVNYSRERPGLDWLTSTLTVSKSLEQTAVRRRL
jgi:hypothetical protein